LPQGQPFGAAPAFSGSTREKSAYIRKYYSCLRQLRWRAAVAAGGKYRDTADVGNRWEALAINIRWPWKKKKTEAVPDEMAAAAHAAQVAGASAGQEAGAELARERLRYSGKVQAVGFRFQAQMLAQKVGVTGWVKNLEDGDVLLEVQGTASQLEAFRRGIEDLSKSRNTWIEARLASREACAVRQESGFRVQY
jgi:acylphosphatase